MSNITSQKTIEVLRGIFSIHGLPRTLVSVPDLLARSLRYLLILNTSSLHRTIHLLMDQYGTFKQALKRIPDGFIQEKLVKFLFMYRITPHSTTGVPPAELLMGRRLCSRFDAMYPDIGRTVEAKQWHQKKSNEGNRAIRTFTMGDKDLIIILNGYLVLLLGLRDRCHIQLLQLMVKLYVDTLIIFVDVVSSLIVHMMIMT